VCLKRVVHKTRRLEIDRPITAHCVTKRKWVVFFPVVVVLEDTVLNVQFASERVLNDSRESLGYSDVVAAEDTTFEGNRMSELG
jgi:hypothetical protein